MKEMSVNVLQLFGKLVNHE